MALQDPNAPSMPSYWDDDFDAAYLAAMSGGADVQAPAPTAEQQVATVEYPIGSGGNGLPPPLPPPPPPPPPPQKLAAPGVPVAEEVPLGALPPPMPNDASSSPAAPVVAESAPPSLNADAISGVDQRPPDDAFTSTSPVPTERPEEELSAEGLGARWATLSPEEQEKHRSEIEGAKAKFQAAKLIEASTAAAKKAEQNALDYEASIKESHAAAAKLDAEAKALSEHDPLDDIATWQKVTGVIAALIGGFGANKSGRNFGLEAVDSIVEGAIARQKTKMSDLGARRNAVGEDVTRAGDSFKAAETVRLAVWDKITKKLEADVQQYDPRGTTALAYMDKINAAKAKRAELLHKYQLEQQKKIEDALKLQREYATLQETQRHNIAGEQTDRTRAGADYLRAKTEADKAKAENGTTYTPEQLQQLYGVTDPALVPPIPMNTKQYDKWLEAKQKGGQVTKVTQETAAEERNRELAVGEIVDDQGNPIKFRTAEYAGKLAKSKGSADNAVRLIDKIIAARSKSGWESDWVNGPVKRQLDGDMASLQLEKKNTDELGVLAGPDMGLINKSIGTSDPSEWRDSVLPGLRNARSNIVEQLNRKVAAEAILPKGRKPARWEPPSLADLPESKPLIQGKTSVEQGEGAKRGKAGETIQKVFYGVGNAEAAASAENAANVGPTGLPPDDDKRVLEAIAAAQGSGADAGNAVQRLADAAASEREAVSNAVLSRIRTESPAVYELVLAKLPPEKRDAIRKVTEIDESNIPPFLRGTP